MTLVFFPLCLAAHGSDESTLVSSLFTSCFLGPLWFCPHAMTTWDLHFFLYTSRACHQVVPDVDGMARFSGRIDRAPRPLFASLV